MRLSIAGVVAMGPLLLSACPAQNDDAAARPKAAIQSVYTDIGARSCKKDIDRTDPNETPYLVCAGVAGYALIVRHVDAGRQSIDVVDAAQRVMPLNYQEFVTRRMFSLDAKAEWRVAVKDGKQVPIALIVRVLAREDNDDPEKVTRTYLAVAKIEPNAACVTDKIAEGTQSEAAVRNAADSARERPCAPPQPRMSADGVAIR